MARRILITGATGFIGSHLCRVLVARGDHPVAVSRDAARAARSLGAGVEVVAGDPAEPGAWQGAVDGCHAVVNLAGPSIGGQRWDARYRQLLLDTRVDITRHVVEAIAAAANKPAALISASGVDCYSFARDLPFESKDEADEFAEDGPIGDGFLARLCRDWEAEARRAEAQGVRVVVMRTGVVLGPGAEALDKMALPFKLFAGGRIGDGEQFFSWVHVDDVAGAYAFALDRAELSGPVNLVAPGTIRQGDFARQLGAALGRPSWLPVPAFALRAAVGGIAEYMLHGRQAVPAKLAAAGYAFRYPTADQALRASV